MTAFDELTWQEAMRQGHTALIESERLYDDINAAEGRSILDIEAPATGRGEGHPGPGLARAGQRAGKPGGTVWPPRDLNVGPSADMASSPEPIRIGNRHPLAVPPARRDPARRLGWAST
jgi:hypothetical protein